MDHVNENHWAYVMTSVRVSEFQIPDDFFRDALLLLVTPNAEEEAEKKVRALLKDKAKLFTKLKADEEMKRE